MSKISIIVPVYNVETYLEECISSIIQQTYKNYELLLLNDGSTDKSGMICDHFAQQNPEHIVVIHKENQGPLPTRMLGIEYASGDIIVFLDSDDCLRKDALKLLAECFQTENCDMVLYDAGMCPNYSSREITHPFDGRTIFREETKKELYQKLITYQIPNSVCLKAIKKDCTYVPEYFLQFNNVKHGEDLLMSAYFITNCKKIVYLKKALYYYRIRLGSAVCSYDHQRAESIKIVHTEISKCMTMWEMPELKPVHNARKVKGWVDTLKLLLSYKNSMMPAQYQEQVKSLAEDPYFISAYLNMDVSCLSISCRIIAKLLYKKKYSIINLMRQVKWLLKSE